MLLEAACVLNTLTKFCAGDFHALTEFTKVVDFDALLNWKSLAETYHTLHNLQMRP